MKKRFFGAGSKLASSIAVISLAAVFSVFTGCTNGSGSVSFNLSMAEALGATERSVSRSARDAGDSAPTATNLIKLLPNGSIENATEVAGYVEFGAVKGIFRPPVGDETYIWYEEPAFDGNGDEVLSCLVCVHPDGTYTDLLYENVFYGYYSLVIDTDNCLQFDDDGNLYISAREGGGWEEYIYKFDPQTRERTTLIESKTEYLSDDYKESYHGFALSADKSTLYVYASNFDSSTLLKSIPVDDPSNVKVIFENTRDFAWAYDKDQDKIYASYYSDKTLTYKTVLLSTDGTVESVIDDMGYSLLIATSKGVLCGYPVGGLEPGSDSYNMKNLNSGETFNIPVESGEFIGVADGGKYYEQHGDDLFLVAFRYNPDYKIDYQEYTEEERIELFDNNYWEFVKCSYLFNLYRINLNDYSYENVFENVGGDLTYLESWSTNGEVLYYSGYDKREPTSGKIDLKSADFDLTKVDSAQALSCLTLM